MKPPLRPRLLPARFSAAPEEAAAAGGGGGGGWRGRRYRRSLEGAAWSVREKRALLAALRGQAAGAVPDLQLQLLRKRLPRRSEEEILQFLSRLRGRAAREAVSTRFRLCLEQQRRLRNHLPAPIEVWLELAQVLAEGLEEVTAAAFSQVLTVAATEPLSLLHSLPPHPLPTTMDSPRLSPRHVPSSQPPSNPQTPSPTPPPTLEQGGFSVDFPRVYKFLAQLCRGGGKGPPLPPAESAVLLALLGSLPQQLGALDLDPLRGHLRGSYSSLMAPRDPPPPESPPQEPSPPETPPKSSWRQVGLCPLNLFLVPVGLLELGEPSG